MGSTRRSTRGVTRRLAALLAAGALVGLAAACGSTAASASAPASATLEVSVSASVSPELTKYIPSESPTTEATPTPVPTPTPLPNLTGDTPTIDPDPPTCNVNFVLDFVVRNTGLGPTLGEARVIAAATRNSDGRIDLKVAMPNVPVLASGASVRLTQTVKITGAGPHTMTMYVDSSLWVSETNEGDNEISRSVNVLYGSCPK